MSENDRNETPFRYTPQLANEIEARWQDRWAAEGTFRAPNPTGDLAPADPSEREAVAATAWDGAPLAYTTSYYSPAELDAAFDRYRAEFGGFGCIPRSHMWHRNSYNQGERAATDDGHGHLQVQVLHHDLLV